jgi:hypothetical protein
VAPETSKSDNQQRQRGALAPLTDCALERAIEGEERFVVRHGEVVASWRRYDTPLLMFLLRNRRRQRYDAHGLRGGERALSATEERARAIEEEREAEAILDSINAKMERMRERWIAAKEAQREEEEEGACELQVPQEDLAPADEAEQAPAPEASLPGIRPLPDLLREGDKALGLARRHPYAREEAMLMRARMPPPLTLEQEVARRLMDDMDAGRIGPRARGEVPGSG